MSTAALYFVTLILLALSFPKRQKKNASGARQGLEIL